MSRGLKGIKPHPQEGGHVKALVVNPVTLNPLHHLEQLRVLKIQPAWSQCWVSLLVGRSAGQPVNRPARVNQSANGQVCQSERVRQSIRG